MELRSLGTSGLKVSKLSLGAMAFGSGWTRDMRIDADLTKQLVYRALDSGINLIDTAETYGRGRSEEVVGQATKGRRNEAVLATKVGFAGLAESAPLAPQKVMAACEGSLRRLGVDHIDLYLLHRPDPVTPLTETMGALTELVERGLVRAIGCSNFKAFEVSSSVTRQRLLGRPAFCAVEVYNSLIGRDVEHEILPQCSVDGLGVLVHAPLAGGLLTGWSDTTGADGRRRMGALPSVEPDLLERARTALKTVADNHGVSMAQAALAWAMAQPDVTSVIAGVSSMEQLEDNIAAAGLVLTPDELAELDEATVPTPIYPASAGRDREYTVSQARPS